MNKKEKIIIYQVLPRLFGNDNDNCIYNGSLTENGSGKMSDFTSQTLKEIKKLGITHIWYTGIIEHATKVDFRRYNIRPDHPALVKGKAGSPYAIKDYYDVDPALASDIPERINEFDDLVRRTHKEGMKVIFDFVPNHVARQYSSDSQPEGSSQLGANDDPQLSFSPYNNFYYIPNTELEGRFDMKDGAPEPYKEIPAKATGNNRFDAYPTINDWFETVKLNYGIDYMNGCTYHFSPIPDTWIKMLDILLFWASKGIDGFRCDMAEMVPVEFWSWVIPKVKEKHPDLLFIAEIYNFGEYKNYILRGKFDYIYDKVGLYDTLREVICGKRSAKDITGCWQSLNGIEDKMLNFLENHDEQRVASDFFATDPLKAIPALIVSACMNTNPFMIYFGQEFGERGMDKEGFSGLDGRTTIFDFWSITTIRHWRHNNTYDGKLLTDQQRHLYGLYCKILNLCNDEAALSQGSFFDLMYANLNGWKFNADKLFVFFRKYRNELLLIIANFDDQPVDIAINIPSHAFDFLQIPQIYSIAVKDLLTDEEEVVCLLPYHALDTHVKANGGKILKFKI